MAILRKSYILKLNISLGNQTLWICRLCIYQSCDFCWRTALSKVIGIIFGKLWKGCMVQMPHKVQLVTMSTFITSRSKSTTVACWSVSWWREIPQQLILAIPLVNCQALLCSYSYGRWPSVQLSALHPICFFDRFKTQEAIGGFSWIGLQGLKPPLHLCPQLYYSMFGVWL